MFLAGIDISGVPNVENYKYLAIVLGTLESITGLHKNTGIREIHMSKLSEDKQKQISKSLSFDGINNTAFCIALDREQTVFSVKNNGRIKKARISTEKIYRQYDYLLRKYIRPKIENFTITNHKTAMNELIMQCDGDTSHIVKNWALKMSKEGVAYQISDAVAYCNNKKNLIKGVIELDFRQEILDEMYQELLR